MQVEFISTPEARDSDPGDSESEVHSQAASAEDGPGKSGGEETSSQPAKASMLCCGVLCSSEWWKLPWLQYCNLHQLLCM